jgi:hypothetical protein
MRRIVLPALAVLMFGSLMFAPRSQAGHGSMDSHDSHGKSDKHHGKGHHERGNTLLQFQHMYGVDGPFVGDANPIRGVPGDELPWTIALARGRLDTDGHLSLIVRGLVFTNDEVVPPELRGTNDETQFRALVSCLSEEGTSVVERNVVSDPFPATPQGDSRIDAHLVLPNPCVAPIVMVLAGSEDKWFAVDGNETQ